MEHLLGLVVVLEIQGQMKYAQSSLKGRWRTNQA